jgi:hypothetical protein
VDEKSIREFYIKARANIDQSIQSEKLSLKERADDLTKQLVSAKKTKQENIFPDNDLDRKITELEKEIDNLSKKRMNLNIKTQNNEFNQQERDAIKKARNDAKKDLEIRIEEIREELSFLQQTESLRVFIYGAGLQTSILLKIWEQSSLPEILGIIITEKNDKTDFNGYPMMPLDTLTQSDVDFILLSSKSFEAEMASNLDAKLPTVKRLSFWIKELTRL